MSKHKRDTEQSGLFRSETVLGGPGRVKLFEERLVANTALVECLGMTFENDEASREYFLPEQIAEHDKERMKVSRCERPSAPASRRHGRSGTTPPSSPWPQNPRECPPGGPQTPHVVRPGAYQDW